MDLKRISRIPARIKQDARTIKLVSNWLEVLWAKLNRRRIGKIFFRNGMVLEVPDGIDLLFLFHEIWIDGVYERRGYEIKAGNKVADIGGNIGAFALWAAGRAPGVSIRSYEPFPQNVEYLKKNIAASGLDHIRVFQAAVAGQNGDRFLRVEDSWVGHSLSDEAQGPGGIRVSTVTLDTIIEDAGHCDFLKIDCEGGEYEIFYGSKPETLEKIDRIVCEYHDGPGGNGIELKAFFEANSFRVDVFRKLDEATGVLFLTNLR
jgi:FkbM family methyltransferase